MRPTWSLFKGTTGLGRNILGLLNEESAYVWDKDGRSCLFQKESPDYVPTGSLLKVYYYPQPLTTGEVREARSIETALWTERSASTSSNDQDEKKKRPCFKLPFDMHHQKNSSLPFLSPTNLVTKKSTTANKTKVETKTGVNPTPPHSFYGLLLSVHRNSVNSTFTLRNVVDGVGVEMTFPLYSPLLLALETKLKGTQKRSKWYWLRDKPLKQSTFT